MSTSDEFAWDDGTPVRFLLAPAEGTAAPGADLPDGMGTAVPVAREGRSAAEFAAGALRGALKPLGPLLQEVHDAARGVPDPPTEMTVTFGVQIGHDLKFGIVGTGGQAHLTVTACWRSAPAADTGTAAAAE